MLKNTFCHLPGVGAISEKNLWAAGIHSWECLENDCERIPQKRLDRLRSLLSDSYEEMKALNPHYFYECLPSHQHWRLFPDFQDSIAYLDIETTGLDPRLDHITTIAFYDSKDIHYYVRGKNLDEFKDDIQKYKLLATYNGKTFDVPFIESRLGIKLNHAHIDLRYILKNLGYSGGLKSCERQLGFDRGKLRSVDGYMAVMLWYEYKNTGDRKALDTLLAYNIEDVLSLENLLVFAFNKKLRETPFYPEQKMPDRLQPRNPFDADIQLIDKLKGKAFFGVYRRPKILNINNELMAQGCMLYMGLVIGEIRALLGKYFP